MRTRGPTGNARGRMERLLLGGIFSFLALTVVLPGDAPVRAEEPMTAASVIAKGEERFRTLRDYECTVDMELTEGKKVEKGTGTFWFKQPRMMRIRLRSGTGKGSEIAVDSQGQLRGRKRGILSFVAKRLKASDRRLPTIRGTSMLELDWGSFFLKYHAAVLRPDATILLEPHPTAASPYRVVVSYPDLGKSVREIYALDPLQWSIVEGAVYEDDTLVEHVVFRDIKFDTGVAPSWFRL